MVAVAVDDHLAGLKKKIAGQGHDDSPEQDLLKVFVWRPPSFPFPRSRKGGAADATPKLHILPDHEVIVQETEVFALNKQRKRKYEKVDIKIHSQQTQKRNQ